MSNQSTTEKKSDTEVKTPANKESDNTQKTDWEKIAKDNKASFTKGQQEIARLKAENKVLRENSRVSVTMDEATKKELDELKFNDPDAWRARVNQMEAEALKEQDNKINNLTSLQQRELTLKEFNEKHPDVVITDTVIQNDIPPRITRKLEAGTVTFEEFLQECVDYLNTPKVVGDANKTLNQPNLGEMGGSDTPSSNSVKEDIREKYKNTAL